MPLGVGAWMGGPTRPWSCWRRVGGGRVVGCGGCGVGIGGVAPPAWTRPAARRASIRALPAGGGTGTADAGLGD